MMKVVLDENDNVIAYGPDSEQYQPVVKDGQRLVILPNNEALALISVETPEQIIARLESALDRHLDSVANQYRYESIRTMVTYATSEHPTFGNEGKAAIKFRDAVYAYGIQCLQDVQAEQREIPTEEELIAELPLFEDFL